MTRIYKPKNAPDDSFDRYTMACRHGSSCKFLAGGQCFFRHDGTPPRVELMTADLSSDPVALPAFGHVDTEVRWGIRRAETLAGFNVLDDGRLAVPGKFCSHASFQFCMNGELMGVYKDSPQRFTSQNQTSASRIGTRTTPPPFRSPQNSTPCSALSKSQDRTSPSQTLTS